jgi:shikimate kinase
VSVAHIVLLGPMGAGKTTLGLALAAQLEVDLVDSDQGIREMTGQNAAEIANAMGVHQLHALERDLVSAALSSTSRKVIAAAASVVDDEATRLQMGRHLCLWIEADATTLAERRGSAPHRRSMTDEEAEELNRVRRLSVADLVIGEVDTTHSTAKQSAAAAMDILAEHISPATSQ